MMLVKFELDQNVSTENEVDVLIIQQLENDIEALQQLKQDFLDQLKALQQTQTNSLSQRDDIVTRLQAQIAIKQQQITKSRDDLKRLTQKLEQQTETHLSSLTRQSAQQKDQQSSDVIELVGHSEQQYLLGLKVEGRYIGLLIDASASMSDEKLIDIIERKVSNDEHKKNGPKWQRTKRIVRWLLARVPQDSQFSLIFYNQQSHVLGHKGLAKITEQENLYKIQKDIDDFVPQGATNLEQGLKAIKKNNPNITDLYIVTDGLPTKGDKKSFSKCVFTNKTISGECRVQLLHSAIKYFGSNVKINIVLLPLEGDPQAVSEYWKWTYQTNGLLMTPAKNWP
ncbi:MAG: vWA domain-containing protein [Pseudomonadota bacterium]